MTDQSVVRPTDFAQPRNRPAFLDNMEAQLKDAVQANNKSTGQAPRAGDTGGGSVNVIEMTPVQAIALYLKDLTYDQAQEVGAGLAKAIEDNADKERGFDFSASPIKLAPVLAHLVQTWASVVKTAMETKTETQKAD